jgi:hypothetical protein
MSTWLTDEQRELLEDKFVLWDKASRTGAMDMRDYQRRAADALKAALAICSATPAPSVSDAERAAADAMAEALEPVLEYARGFPSVMPDNFVLTKGSDLARKQITVGDLRAILTAYKSARGAS